MSYVDTGFRTNLYAVVKDFRTSNKVLKESIDEEMSIEELRAMEDKPDELVWILALYDFIVKLRSEDEGIESSEGLAVRVEHYCRTVIKGRFYQTGYRLKKGLLGVIKKEKEFAKTREYTKLQSELRDSKDAQVLKDTRDDNSRLRKENDLLKQRVRIQRDRIDDLELDVIEKDARIEELEDENRDLKSQMRYALLSIEELTKATHKLHDETREKTKRIDELEREMITMKGAVSTLRFGSIRSLGDDGFSMDEMSVPAGLTLRSRDD